MFLFVGLLNSGRDACLLPNTPLVTVFFLIYLFIFYSSSPSPLLPPTRSKLCSRCHSNQPFSHSSGAHQHSGWATRFRYFPRTDGRLSRSTSKRSSLPPRFYGAKNRYSVVSNMTGMISSHLHKFGKILPRLKNRMQFFIPP